MLFGKSLPIRFVAVYHPSHTGVIPTRGVIFSLGVNDQGVTHARESFTPLTPVFVEQCIAWVCAHLGFIVHTVSGISNRWSGIRGGTVWWKIGWNGECS